MKLAAKRTAKALITAAPAFASQVYPIRIADKYGNTSDLEIIEALNVASNNGIRILNIPFASDNLHLSLADASVHPALHAYLKYYHDQKNGLAFFPAGNGAHGGHRDPSPRQPYFIMVTAMDNTARLAKFSNYGGPVWFTAPGQDIYGSNKAGKVASVSGTSFAAPLVSSIAAMILSVRPSLKNTEVEQLLIRSARNVTPFWNEYTGFGIPDALKAMKLLK